MKKKNATNLAILILAILLFAPAAQAAPGDLDTTFGGTGKTTTSLGGGIDRAQAVAVQTDGKIVVAGSSARFVSGVQISRFAVARYNINGSSDQTFDGDGKLFTVVGGFSSFANAVRIQPDGKIVVAGYLLTGGSTADIAVVRYNADGSLDTTFNTDGIVTTNIIAFDSANALLIQTDGKIVVVSGAAVVRYNTNGSLDTTFDADGFQTAANGNGAAIQADGKIVTTGSACGGFPISTCSVQVTRLNPNGSFDTTFDADGFVTVSIPGLSENGRSVGIQPGNNTVGNPDKIVIVGTATTDALVVRLNLNGTLDTTFDADGYLLAPINPGSDAAVAVGFQVSGISADRIVIAGHTGAGGSNATDFFALRLFLNGAYDTAFDVDGIAVTDFAAGNDEGKAMAIRDGKILVAGFATLTSEDFALARFNLADGSPDATFDGDGKKNQDIGDLRAIAKSVAIQTDGKIVVAGGIEGSPNSFALIRRRSNGSLDTTFDADGKTITNTGGIANAVAIQTDGKIVAAGGANNDFVVVRYNANGSLDTTFDTDGIAVVSINAGADVANAVAIQTDGKIIVAGSTFNGSNTDFAVLRLNTDGTPDNSFDTDGRVTTSIGAGGEEGKAAAIQTDGKIIVAGFSSNGANNDFAAVRYNTNGALDFSFSFDGRVTTAIGTGNDVGNALAIDSGKVIVAGSSSNGANNDFAVVRYNANGSLDTTFDADGKTMTEVGEADEGNAVAVQTDGKILVAGSAFTGVNTDFAVVRYNANGSLDESRLSSTDLYGSAGRVTVDVSGVNDAAFGLALDSFGNAVAAGETDGLFGVIRLQGDVAPTAALVTVSGRISTPSGAGLTNAAVLMTDMQGNVRAARSTTFGHFQFEAVEAGQTYIFEVRANRFRFAAQVVTVTEDLSELSFTPQL